MHKYGLEDMGDELVSLWGPKEHQKSVRELALYVNEEVLDAALRDNNIIYDMSMVTSLVPKIDADETSFIESDLNERGVDTDAVGKDFVSYQSIYNYLTNVRGESYQEEPKPVATTVSSLEGTDTHTEQIYENVTQKLQNQDELDGETPEVDVDVGLVCPSCGTRTDARIYLHNGGCPASTCVGYSQPGQ